MGTSEEKRWEMLQRVLLAESSGAAPVRVASQRTLFGIKSHVEQVVDAVAEEDALRAAEAIRRRKAAEGVLQKATTQECEGGEADVREEA